jgi:hypothetical protein
LAEESELIAHQLRTQWDEVLGQLEAETARLAEVRRDAKTPAAVGGWEPPTLGNLPDEFADRVRELIARQHVLQAEFEADLRDARMLMRMPVQRLNPPDALLIDRRA